MPLPIEPVDPVPEDPLEIDPADPELTPPNVELPEAGVLVIPRAFPELIPDPLELEDGDFEPSVLVPLAELALESDKVFEVPAPPQF